MLAGSYLTRTKRWTVGTCKVQPGLHATRKLEGEGEDELNMVQVGGNGVHQQINAIDR